MRFTRPFRGFLAAAAVAVAAACNTEELNIPAVVPMEEQQWAPALQVTLNQFTRLSSGVFYLDSVVGSGPTPLSGTPNVSVYYSGYLPSGSQFDAKPNSGAPVCFPLQGLIAGWQVGMQGMRTGGKRRLLIPPGYGYGASSNGPIPPNANLLFNIELVATGCTP